MVRLKDICVINMGQSPASSSYNTSSDGVPFFQGNADFGRISPNVRVWCNAPTKIAHKGDILISVRAPIGALNIADTECCIGRGLAALTANYEMCLRQYLLYAISSKVDELNAKGTGSTFKAISKDILAETEIPLPKREEQCYIVSILDKISDLITMRKRQLEILDELIKARFVEMFGTVDNNRFGWVIKTIGDCCTLKSGTSLPAEIENEGGEIPYVKVGDMNYPGNERYITTSSRYVSKETAGKGIFPTGSIVFPKRGGAIGTNKKRMTVIPICADLNVMGVSSNGELLPEYLMAYFEMTDLGSLDNGSSVPQINNKDIAPLRICVPPLSAQKEYKDFVAQVDKSKVVVQNALDEAQLLFDSLMQKYFG